MSDPQLIRQFVDILWPPGGKVPEDARFSIWELPHRKSYHFRLDDPQLELSANALNGEGHQVFYGVGLRRADLGPHARGSKPDIVALPGFWADIDLKGLGHAADNLPANIVDVVQEILLPFDWEPSAVVNSGGGVHAYWLFEQPLIITDENRSEVEEMSRLFQERLALGAHKHGWRWDMTADLPRVLRPVGTHNRKHEPRLVEWMGTPGGTRYDYSLFRQALKVKAPAVVAVLGRESHPTAAAIIPRTIDHRSEEAVLDELRTKMRRCRHKDRQETLLQIKNGESFAEPGERDKKLQQVCSWIAFYDQVADPELLVEVLRPSLEAMEAEHPEGAMTIEMAIEKISRAQGDARRKTAISQGADERVKNALVKLARGATESVTRPDLVAVPPPPTPTAKPVKGALNEEVPPVGAPALAIAPVPSPELVPPPPTGRYGWSEVEGFARRQSELSGNRIDLDDWKKRWCIVHGDVVFIFRGGRYLSPMPKSNFRLTAQRDLWWILPEHDPEGRYYWSPQTLKGDDSLRYKTIDETLDELGSAARHLVADVSIPESFYDAKTETFYEAVCPLRPLKPRFDRQVQIWLEKLGGHYKDKLLDWIATVTRLEAPSCGLFVSGPPGVGKSMLANGLARLWHTGGATPMQDIIGDFNADCARCPLVVADEALPSDRNGKTISTKKLRDIISSDSRPLRRKYMANVSLTGTIRCMFLSNSDRLLELGDETLGPDSLDAVAARFLHISATKEPSAYLTHIGGRPGGTKDWVTGDVIARHALWLRDNREVVQDSRFWVQGHVSRMHQMLVTGPTVNGFVVEWIVKYLTNMKQEIRATRGVLVGNGELLVNTSVLAEFWTEYIKNKLNPPSISKINTVLQGLSTATESIRIRANGQQKRYWPLRLAPIIEWSREHGVGDIDDLARVINAKADLGVIIPG